MSRELFQLMRSLIQPAEHPLQEGAWRPAADIYQTREGWLVKFDLAGVRPEDVQLTVAGKQLTVSGTRRDASLAEACQCYHMEIAYSHFKRTVELPYELVQAGISTEYRQGMLLVRVRTGEGSEP